MTKYELNLNDTLELDGITLYRIKALRDFSDVKKGDIGGYVESESNLSHEGNAWLYDDAIACGNAMVYDNAKVSGNARVYGNAEVYGYARVSGNANIYGNADVSNAKVYGNVEVHGSAIVYGNDIVDHGEIN